MSCVARESSISTAKSQAKQAAFEPAVDSSKKNHRLNQHALAKRKRLDNGQK